MCKNEKCSIASAVVPNVVQRSEIFERGENAWREIGDAVDTETTGKERGDDKRILTRLEADIGCRCCWRRCQAGEM